MLDKLQQDFDLYYTEADNFNAGYNARKHEVETDKMLSRAGKFEQAEKIKTEHLNNVNNLGERFNAEFQTRVERISDVVNGAKSDIELTAIQKKFSKGASLSGDETNRLLLHSMMENKTIMEKSNFQQMLSGADVVQLRKTIQTLTDNKDVEKLGWLKESVSLSGDTALANTIQGQADGIRDSQLSDEQRNLKAISERIEKGVKLFNYTLERLKTGVFVDARQDEV